MLLALISHIKPLNNTLEMSHALISHIKPLNMSPQGGVS